MSKIDSAVANLAVILYICVFLSFIMELTKQNREREIERAHWRKLSCVGWLLPESCVKAAVILIFGRREKKYEAGDRETLLSEIENMRIQHFFTYP